MPTTTVPGYGPIDYTDSDPDRAGRPVVFVHGLLVDGTLWRDVVPTVAEHARCIVPRCRSARTARRWSPAPTSRRPASRA